MAIHLFSAATRRTAGLMAEQARTVRLWWEIVLWPMAFLLVLIMGLWPLGEYYGPDIEGPAVSDVSIVGHRCIGPDLILSVEMTQRSQARFVGLTILRDQSALGFAARPLRWFSLQARSGEETAGFPIGRKIEAGPLLVELACGVPLTLVLRHDSAWGWWTMQAEFGPFGPFGTIR